MAYDHIIIGSGINGLVAAAMPARKGDRVLVLEREARPCGCMFTAEATLPGFSHDVMAATFVLFLTSPAHAALWSWLTLRLLFSQVRRRGPRALAAWFGTTLTPARGWQEAGYQSPLVQSLYAPCVLLCGLTPGAPVHPAPAPALVAVRDIWLQKGWAHEG